MVDESANVDYFVFEHAKDIDRAVAHSIKDLKGKPPDYDDAVLHRRLGRFEQRVEETSMATLATKEKANLGKLQIPEDTRGKKDLARFLGGLTLGVDKLEAVIYKNEYWMKDVPTQTVFAAQGIETFSKEQLQSLEMFSSMAEMLRGVMNGNGEAKRVHVETKIESPTGADITNDPNPQVEPAKFKLKFSKPYQYRDDKDVTQNSQELVEISMFPLEYAPYQMLRSDLGTRTDKVLERSQNATKTQFREMISGEWKSKSAEQIANMIDDYTEEMQRLNADSPHIAIRYARGGQQIELRGNLEVRDGYMGYALKYPQLKTEVFIPIYDKPQTESVADGLHNTDATRLYNIGMAIASAKV
jgi:hypothetical protein